MSSEINATAASLLGLLYGKPMSGWDLYASFENSIGEFWSMTRSQVYRELRSLADAGLVVLGAAEARERRLCTITARGRRAFRAWIDQMPGPETIRFPLLLAIFFGERVAPERLLAICAEHRRIHHERLEKYRALAEELGDAERYPALALDFGIRYEETVLAWLDDLPGPPAVSATKPPKQGAR